MLSADHKIQCQCGHLQGTLSHAANPIRISCYCRDCQTYAHALGGAGSVLDAAGGTEVVATLQQYLTFTSGTDTLTCLSLRPEGLLRWYAGCCKTPIANTARNPKLAYVGIVHNCLGSPAELTDAFGPPHAPVNTRHAKGEVRKSGADNLVCIARIMTWLLRARVTGSWKRGPFFKPGSGEPVAAPHVLGPDELSRARSAV